MRSRTLTHECWVQAFRNGIPTARDVILRLKSFAQAPVRFPLNGARRSHHTHFVVSPPTLRGCCLRRCRRRRRRRIVSALMGNGRLVGSKRSIHDGDERSSLERRKSGVPCAAEPMVHADGVR